MIELLKSLELLPRIFAVKLVSPRTAVSKGKASDYKYRKQQLWGQAGRNDDNDTRHLCRFGICAVSARRECRWRKRDFIPHSRHVHQQKTLEREALLRRLREVNAEIAQLERN